MIWQSTRCLFWLDAHYSGGITAKGAEETPIRSELRAIGNHAVKDHIILIDDARLFTGCDDWPTLEELFGLLRMINPRYRIEVKHDIVRAYYK